MNKNPIDYVMDNNKVLINRGDLILLMHTVINWFQSIGAPNEFIARSLGIICAKNNLPESFMDEFARFSLSFHKVPKEEVDDLFSTGHFSDSIKDWVKDLEEKDEQ